MRPKASCSASRISAARVIQPAALCEGGVAVLAEGSLGQAPMRRRVAASVRAGKVRDGLTRRGVDGGDHSKNSVGRNLVYRARP